MPEPHHSQSDPPTQHDLRTADPRNDRLVRGITRITRAVWTRLPAQVVHSRAGRACGSIIYERLIRHQDRYQSHSTWFLRNVPQLEVLAGLLETQAEAARVSICSVGCSTGAELYSTLWAIRTVRPDLELDATGIDISEGVVNAARTGVYSLAHSASQQGLFGPGVPEVADLPPAIEFALFAREGNELKIRPEYRKSTRWLVGDARDEGLLGRLGLQDIVLANNFLGPMDDVTAAACLRNVARLVKSQGYLVVDGVDLSVKTRVTSELGLLPICTRIEEIHGADVSKQGWPWTRWSHEPFDRTRSDWKHRYATIFSRAEAARITRLVPARQGG